MGYAMPRKGKGVQRILREEKRYREKKKQGKKSWQFKVIKSTEEASDEL
jgi:hypothetical protein